LGTRYIKGIINVLYLAEVKKQTTKFMGGLRTELKLLAFQRNDQSWNRIATEEVISSEDISNAMGEGALVMVNVENGQIQGTPEFASNRLIRFLQDFSRLLEKSKEDEETIEQWRQSLTYQGEELARQRLEMDALLEQIAEKEEEFKLLEEKRLEIEKSWAQLQDRQEQLEGSKISAAFAAEIQSLVNSLRSTLEGEENLDQLLELAFQSLEAGQGILQNHWDQFAKDKNLLEQKKKEAQQQEEEIKNRQKELTSSLASLEQARLDLQLQRQGLEYKQETARRLGIQGDNLDSLREILTGINDLGGDGIELNALENMPLGELETVVANLKIDLDQLVGFVNEQEEELTLRSQSVKELQERISQADALERLTLESELTDEQESAKLLDETLQGQRVTLRKKRNVFSQHLKVLRRRQGLVTDEENTPEIDIGPVITQLDKQKDNLLEEKQKLDEEIEQIQRGLENLDNAVNHYISTQETRDQERQAVEIKWQQTKLELAQIEWRIEFCQSNLQPIQDCLDAIRQKLQNWQESVSRVGQNRERRNQLLSEMEQMLG
jgi:chromosome segregation ATPase